MVLFDLCRSGGAREVLIFIAIHCATLLCPVLGLHYNVVKETKTERFESFPFKYPKMNASAHEAR